MNRIDVTGFASALAIDDSVEVLADGLSIALCRNEAELFAVANNCTHADARLTDGFVMGHFIECPLHQAQFDLASGELIAGPQCAALRTYREVRDGERVFVEL